MICWFANMLNWLCLLDFQKKCISRFLSPEHINVAFACLIWELFLGWLLLFACSFKFMFHTLYLLTSILWSFGNNSQNQERAGAEVVECACLIGLPKFKVLSVLLIGNFYPIFTFFRRAKVSRVGADIP